MERDNETEYQLHLEMQQKIDEARQQFFNMVNQTIRKKMEHLTLMAYQQGEWALVEILKDVNMDDLEAQLATRKALDESGYILDLQLPKMVPEFTDSSFRLMFSESDVKILVRKKLFEL